MLLALVETATSSAPLDKGKRVVEVTSDDDKDSAEGQVFSDKGQLSMPLKQSPLPLPPHMAPNP